MRNLKGTPRSKWKGSSWHAGFKLWYDIHQRRILKAWYVPTWLQTGQWHQKMWLMLMSLSVKMFQAWEARLFVKSHSECWWTISKCTRDSTKKQYVILMADVMFFNNLPFVVTFGWEIWLITAEFTPTHTETQLVCNLKRFVTLCVRAGFVVQTILMDMEFNKVVMELP